MYKLTPSKSADDILLKEKEFFDNIDETVKPLLSKSSEEIYSSDFEEDEEKAEEKATEPEEVELEQDSEPMVPPPLSDEEKATEPEEVLEPEEEVEPEEGEEYDNNEIQEYFSLDMENFFVALFNGIINIGRAILRFFYPLWYMFVNFFISFIFIKILLVGFRRFFIDYSWEKGWNGDIFVALVAMAIGGYLTTYTFFGKNYETVALILSYITLYFWSTKEKFNVNNYITPLSIISFVLFVGFCSKVLIPSINGYLL